MKGQNPRSGKIFQKSKTQNTAKLRFKYRAKPNSRQKSTDRSYLRNKKCSLGKDTEAATVSSWKLQLRTCKAETGMPQCICLRTTHMEEGSPVQQKSHRRATWVLVLILLGKALNVLAFTFFRVMTLD